MITKPEIKSNEILDKIQPSFSSGHTPSQFELAKLKKDAQSIKNINPAQGYSLLGLIACLEVDIEGCRSNFKKAIRLDGDMTQYLNYSSSLLSFGLMDESFQLIDSMLDKFKGDPEYLEVAMDVAIQSGRPNQVENSYQMLKRLKPNDSLVKANSYKDIADEFIRLGISDEMSNKILNIAYNIVRERGLRVYSHLIFTNDDDPSGDLYYSMRVNATIEKVVDMNIQLSECLANDESLNFENTFSIAYQS